MKIADVCDGNARETLAAVDLMGFPGLQYTAYDLQGYKPLGEVSLALIAVLYCSRVRRQHGAAKVGPRSSNAYPLIHHESSKN